MLGVGLSFQEMDINECHVLWSDGNKVAFMYVGVAARLLAWGWLLICTQDFAFQPQSIYSTWLNRGNFLVDEPHSWCRMVNYANYSNYSGIGNVLPLYNDIQRGATPNLQQLLLVCLCCLESITCVWCQFRLPVHISCRKLKNIFLKFWWISCLLHPSGVVSRFMFRKAVGDGRVGYGPYRVEKWGDCLVSFLHLHPHFQLVSWVQRELACNAVSAFHERLFKIWTVNLNNILYNTNIRFLSIVSKQLTSSRICCNYTYRLWNMV